MFQWLEELYEIRRRNRVCESCEVLKVEIAQIRREKDLLLQHVLHPKDETQPVMQDANPGAILRGHKPWRVKQQELEMQDRLQHNRIMAEFKAKVDPVKTEQLEKEMGIADG